MPDIVGVIAQDARVAAADARQIWVGQRGAFVAWRRLAGDGVDAGSGAWASHWVERDCHAEVSSLSLRHDDPALVF